MDCAAVLAWVEDDGAAPDQRCDRDAPLFPAVMACVIAAMRAGQRPQRYSYYTPPILGFGNRIRGAEVRCCDGGF